MRAVIFGAGGQDGVYLKELLLQKKIEVVSVSRRGNFIIGDVSESTFVASVLKKYIPDFIFNLAANSSTKHDILFENHNTISTGTLNILEGARLICPDAKIFISGSALQFKNDGNPIDESTPFEAKSAYAVSRIHSVYSARYYRDVYNLKIYIGYFFNHDSPLRSENFINQKIIRAVQRIKYGSDEMIQIGNINVRKEFGFAKDSVKAILTLITQNNIYEAVIGTGIAYSIKDWIKLCFDIADLNWENYIIENNSFIPDYKTLVSNPALINSIGWNHKTDIFKLANIMMNNGL